MYNVMQVVDSLQLGGLESVAVNYANNLSEKGPRSCLCTTRADGPLSERLLPGVARLDLHRKGIVDVRALRQFVAYMREHQVHLLHAHGTSIFFSVLASWFVPGLRVIWHVHFGRYATENESAWLYRLAIRWSSGVIAVNQPLAKWAQSHLGVASERVWYVPNFVVEPKGIVAEAGLPGLPGKRIVCVANLRPEKDHLSLVDAMRMVVNSEPAAVLLLVGNESNREHVARVKARVQQNGLQKSVFIIGSRADVWPILKSCDAGVLSSASEGLPLALLEYGMVGLPTVATRVGQVPEVLNNGGAGILVSPGASAELASAMLRLLHSAELRRNLGNELRRHVQQNYSETVVMDKVVRIYKEVLNQTALQTNLAA